MSRIVAVSVIARTAHSIPLYIGSAQCLAGWLHNFYRLTAATAPPNGITTSTTTWSCSSFVPLALVSGLLLSRNAEGL
ncbi:hypothetical protein [Sporisorium scitamineum]|uniref:Uncharacterized protein n=1 Tax=Sporisorium scitamineum TaxID=49012 RepID=A0A0F7S5W8_9BASI|nr:hypothetical protein [Sporisorium scitamineum]